MQFATQMTKTTMGETAHNDSSSPAPGGRRSFLVGLASLPLAAVLTACVGDGSDREASSESDGTTTAPSANFLDRINFGDSASEAAHAMNLSADTNGTGAFSQTYRVVAPSATTAEIGDASKNRALGFTLACDPALQNYLTVKLWGGDADVAILYLYDSSRGYEITNYYGSSTPEIDYQDSTTPMAPGRFVYVTLPIPLTWTTGRTTVALSINAAKRFFYYSDRTTAQLAAGETSRPVYGAFSHTEQMLNLIGDDILTSISRTDATALSFDSSYVAACQTKYTKRINTYVDDALAGGEWTQAWGSTWDAAVNAGNVPERIVGLFLGSVTPGNTYTTSGWLDHAATYMSTGNGNPMLRIDDMAHAYAVSGLTPTWYHSPTLLARIIAALDAAYCLQSLNGAFGNLTGWVGLGATVATNDNPQGRLSAVGNDIEGNGTLALGSALLMLKGDSAFLAALDANISTNLVANTARYIAWGEMFAKHVSFLLTRHGSAPNQDILQARALLACNEAAKFIDTRYGTGYATVDSSIVSYVKSACGVTYSSKGPLWFSPNGLSLEVHGVGNGGYDGSYGWNGTLIAVELARMLEDARLETATDHPVRDLALRSVGAFSNFIVPSLTAASVATLRSEQALTFRKNENVGIVNAGTCYLAAYHWNDSNSLHAFHLERLYGISPPEWSSGNIDEGENRMFRFGAAYMGLVQAVITAAGGGTVPDDSGVTFLHESGHADAAWADPIASVLSLKQNGQHVFVALNWRPYGHGDASTYVKPGTSGTLSNIARLHLSGDSVERIVTLSLPTNTATGATSGFTSGSYGGLYVLRYGLYVVALNPGTASATLTLPAAAAGNWAYDWVAGRNQSLAISRSFTVAAGGALLLTLGDTAATALTASIVAH